MVTCVVIDCLLSEYCTDLGPSLRVLSLLSGSLVWELFHNIWIDLVSRWDQGLYNVQVMYSLIHWILLYIVWTFYRSWPRPKSFNLITRSKLLSRWWYGGLWTVYKQLISDVHVCRTYYPADKILIRNWKLIVLKVARMKDRTIYLIVFALYSNGLNFVHHQSLLQCKKS